MPRGLAGYSVAQRVVEVAEVAVVVVVVIAVVTVAVAAGAAAGAAEVAVAAVVKSFLSPNHGWCYSQTKGGLYSAAQPH